MLQPDDGYGSQVRCGSCGRTFNPAAYEHHSRICARVFGGKRKVFSSSAARVEGTEAAAYNHRPGANTGRGGAGGRPQGHAGPSSSSQADDGPLPTWKAQVRGVMCHV